MSVVLEKVKAFFPRLWRVLKNHGAIILRKAGRVFVYTFVPAFAAAVGGVFTIAALKAAFFVAVPVALSAAWNVIKNYRYEKVAEKIEAAWNEANTGVVVDG